MLDNLVARTLRTATLDSRISIALQAQSVFAHIDPPHVLNRA
jgi:hypothetical protein